MSRNIERKLLDIGLALSGEKDHNRLMETILTLAMEIVNCDAGTLYFVRDNLLQFKIMRNQTLRTYQGGSGETITMPPVPLVKSNVCAYAALSHKLVNIQDVRKNSEFNFDGPEKYDAMTGYRTISMLVVPMENGYGDVIGVLQLINAMSEDGEITGFDPEYEEVISAVASQTALALSNNQYVEDIKELFHSFVQAMSAAVDERSPYNANHSRNMARYGARFLEYEDRVKGPYPFTENEKEQFVMSILLHDIGKLVIPLEVMNKPTRLDTGLDRILQRLDCILLLEENAYLSGKSSEAVWKTRQKQAEEARRLILTANTAPWLSQEDIAAIQEIGARVYRDVRGMEHTWLTPWELDCLTIPKGTLTQEERAVMENHVVITGKLLEQIRFSREYDHVAEWAKNHHEMLDGSGYPRHLRGGEIPNQVRLMTILDVFDALTASDRPYRSAMPLEKAIGVLREMAGEGKLDRDILEEFIQSRVWEEGPDEP